MISVVDSQTAQTELLIDRAKLAHEVELVISKVPAVDVHTHVFPPQFQSLFLSGIDDLLTYHYLIAETFRSTKVSHANFWRMSKTERADLVWQTLFVENSPVSEAARGIISILTAFELDTRAPNLNEAREFFATQDPHEHVSRVLEMACVSDLVMTNDPLHEQEANLWEQGLAFDPRLHASLRLDSVLNDWPNGVQLLASQDFDVSAGLEGRTFDEVRRFLDRWIAKMSPLYMAVSLPDEFKYPDHDARELLLKNAILPCAREHDLPLALMIGVRRGVNPALRAAGDGMGRADVAAVERLCVDNPDVRFLTTFLSRENQHELCVAARKFNNLMPFGCWWFLNNPSIVSEITAERIELLGLSFVPQHSDARVLEQLIYKWQHSRTVIAQQLFEMYGRLLDSGRAVTPKEISRDVTRLFSENVRAWTTLNGRP